MEYIRTHRWVQLALAVLVALLALFAWQVNYLHWAHSSFATYAQFRGCETITSKTATDGTCTTASGQTVKIVEFDGKWYLDGDLPWACVPGTNFCVGF